jgi:alanine dehydrogenase
MNIGVPKETFVGENRIALSPLAVKTLTAAGHNVFIEAGAGNVSFYDDTNYEEAGATIVYDADEAYGRADIVAKVERPDFDEQSMLRQGQILLGFLQPAALDSKRFASLIDNKITTIGYELIQNEFGEVPIVKMHSELAGKMMVKIAADCLDPINGGRGVFIGGAPGVPPAEIVIIGAGSLGRSAAISFIKMGASVTLLDCSTCALRTSLNHIPGSVVTATATREHYYKALSYADVVITAIRTPEGGRVPEVITRDMVKAMKNGAVVIDASIDQGGACETSRPTTLENPTYIEEGVVHYCVPNINSSVPRTASRVLTDQALPLILEIANKGLDAAIKGKEILGKGVITHDGHCCNEKVADLFDLEYKPISDLLK